MNITRHEPRYRPISLLDRLLTQDLNELMEPGFTSRNDTLSDWLPAVDIKETDEQFLLTADLPGVKTADIEITAEAGVLTIQGERHAEKTDESKGYQRFERVTGKFLRRFTLPDTADVEQISATTDNGVLTVAIAKQVKAKPRKITVAAT
jgi:HSP20 family protein